MKKYKLLSISKQKSFVYWPNFQWSFWVRPWTKIDGWAGGMNWINAIKQRFTFNYKRVYTSNSNYSLWSYRLCLHKFAINYSESYWCNDYLPIWWASRKIVYTWKLLLQNFCLPFFQNFCTPLNYFFLIYGYTFQNIN